MKFETYKMEDALESLIDYRGKTPQKSNKGIMTLSAKSVRDGYIDYSQCYFISEEEYKRFMVRGLPKVGDVLLTTEAPLGVVARLDRDDIAIAQRLLTLRGKEDILDTGYLYYYLRSSIGQAKLRERESGTTVTGIKQAEFRKIMIDIPDISTQRKIASIMEGLDEKIKINNEINDNLEQQAQTLYQSIANSSSQSVTLSDFMTIKHGYAFKGKHITFESNNVILVTPGNFKIGGGFQENRCKYFTSEYPSEYVLHPGDLIVTMTDLSKESDTLGYSALIPDNPERIYLHNQRIGLVQFINNDIPKDYVYWFLRSYDYHMRIVGSVSGSTVKHTAPSRILEQTIPVPSNLDKSQVLLLKDTDETIAHNELEIIKLSSIRDSILPRLISGELDVSGLDI